MLIILPQYNLTDGLHAASHGMCHGPQLRQSLSQDMQCQCLFSAFVREMVLSCIGTTDRLFVCLQTSKLVKRFYEALTAGKEFQDDSWKAWATYHPADVQAADAQVGYMAS